MDDAVVAWVKIDDKFYDHPKWADAPGDSIALWLSAMAWCNRNESFDGFIPTAKLSGLVNVRNVRKTADDLVGRRAFIAHEGGYVIHDYPEYQQPEKVKKLRETRSAVGKKGAAARWQLPPALPSGLPRQKNAPSSDPDPVVVTTDINHHLPYAQDEDDEGVIQQALAIHADRLAVGKDNPVNYAAKVIANGEPHVSRLLVLLHQRPSATGHQLADAYKAGGWPRRLEQVLTHPSNCECDGTGLVQNPDDESRTAPSVPCPVTEWPEATIHELRRSS